LHFAAKRILFCRKTDSILPQNGFYFAAKWILFWPKMEIEINEMTQKKAGLRKGSPLVV